MEVHIAGKTPITMVYGTYNYSIHGVYKPTNITGGGHIVGKHLNKCWKKSGKKYGIEVDE